MKEQHAIHTLRAHRADGHTASRQATGTSSGIHPEDRPRLTDERRLSTRPPVYDEDDAAAYETRIPNSTRRYASAPATTPPRTVMRITRHQGPPPMQRASRVQVPVHGEQAPTHRSTGRLHGLVYVGLVLLCMVIGWMALSFFGQWWQEQQDTWHYGMPRTFQVDADVRHGGISHFTVENLNGHIVIVEMGGTTLSSMHLYLGPIFSGAGTELQPATISFADLNGDGYPDMLIAVGTGRYPLLNDHSGFRQVTASDHLISGKGM